MQIIVAVTMAVKHTLPVFSLLMVHGSLKLFPFENILKPYMPYVAILYYFVDSRHVATNEKPHPLYFKGCEGFASFNYGENWVWK